MSGASWCHGRGVVQNLMHFGHYSPFSGSFFTVFLDLLFGAI
jgi:hypothetical protein